MLGAASSSSTLLTAAKSRARLTLGLDLDRFVTDLGKHARA
jgi:hypothetical protein